MEKKVLTRRRWLKNVGISLTACQLLPYYKVMDSPSNPIIMTVNGPIDAKDLGKTLPHEHVLVDFIGADKVSPDRYDSEQVTKKVLFYLKEVKKLGCQAIFECTPNFLGRDPELLQKLSNASGLKFITNTGFYAASNYKHLPAFTKTLSADQMANLWIKEWETGIDQTGIKPGFIKIGNDPGENIVADQKLVRAAAKAHRATGLTIANHLSSGFQAIEKIDTLNILKEEGVHPSAWIWVHAQNEKNFDKHLEVAKQGAWIEFDGISPEQIDQHAEMVINMKQKGFLSQTLISHDAGWYHVGEVDGGNYRSYDTLFKVFLPKLKSMGFTEIEIETLLVKNPAAAFSIQKRALK